jgi:Big-like domain-containing protein
VAAAVPIIGASPSITGTAQQGQLLTLHQGTWTDATTPTVVDVWNVCIGTTCSPITPQPGGAYTPTAADVGHTIEIVETATATDGTATATAQTATVLPAAPTPTFAPSIVGVAQAGGVLTVLHAGWANGPTTILDQWIRCNTAGTSCTPITTSIVQTTYTLVPADVGATILVLETATNTGGSGTAVSALTGVVTTPAGIVPVPASISPPTVSGLAQQGQTLLEANGTWSNNPSTYSYQWVSCGNGGCAPIPGATAQAYTPTAADVGHAIVVLETATNIGGSSAAVASAQTAVVRSPSATSLDVSPGAPMTNQTVTLVATVSSGSGNADPSGQLTFFNGKHAIGGCANKALRATSQSVTLICQSSFAAGTAGLTAVYTPSAGSLVRSSASPLTNLNVGRDPSSTSLAVTKQVVRNKPATYVATVNLPVSNSGPVVPIGSIEFLDTGRPIAACAHRPLRRLAATCVLKYGSLGKHKISARYTGDSNFASSGSPTRSVQVVVHPSRLTVLGFIGSTLQWQFRYRPAYTLVTKLQADGVARGTTILLTCAGGGCPFSRTSIQTKTDGSIDLRPTFRKRHLRVGSQITLRITRPNWIGKYYAFTVRAGRGPLIVLSCVGLSGGRPGQGC